MEKGKQVPSEEVVGGTEIYEKLETLNERVREGAEVRIRFCSNPIGHISEL